MFVVYCNIFCKHYSLIIESEKGFVVQRFIIVNTIETKNSKLQLDDAARTRRDDFKQHPFTIYTTRKLAMLTRHFKRTQTVAAKDT